MALHYFDPCDDYSATNQQSFLSNFFFPPSAVQTLYQIVPGAFGGSAICGSGGTTECKKLITPQTIFIAGGRLQPLANFQGFIAGIIFFDTAFNVLTAVAVQLEPGGAITASVNGSNSYSNTTSLSGTSLGLTAHWQPILSNFYEMEVELTVGTGTSGSLIVKINGATVASVSGVNTQGTAGSTIGYAGYFSGTAGGSSVAWDDIYGCDTTGAAPCNTFLTAVAGTMGPRGWTSPPSANNGVTWTPSAGANYQNVDTLNFNGDAGGYNYTSTAGNVDLFSFPGLPTIANILAVQVTAVGRMDDSGTREIATVLNSGGTNYVGATQVMTANYQKFTDLYVNDPATSSPWAASKFAGTPTVFNGYKCIA
jgi:hypothetical protein